MEDIQKIKEFFSKPLEETTFKVGDKVVLPHGGFTRLEWEGVEYIAISEANVLALIEEQN